MVQIGEHVAGEQIVPGLLGHHAHGQAEFRIGAGEHVDDIGRTALQIGQHALMDHVEHGFADRDVDVAPIDRRLGHRIADDVFVLGRSAGVLARDRDERAAGRDRAFPLADRVLVEFRDGQIMVDGRQIDEPVPEGRLLLH